MKRTFILALLVAFVAAAGLAGAQSLTGTVVGVITDEQGGVLPGVTVTLTGTQGSQTQVTDAKGEYRFLALTPGLYNLKAELQGFKPKVQQSIDVGISKTAMVNFALQVGGVEETVNVVANAVMIDTTTTATDTTMSQDLLFNMPIMHANPAVNLLQYIPGVTTTSSQGSSAFGAAADGGNSLMLDGVDTRDPSGGTAYAFWNYNIIEEVQVGALGQTAEYGGFTGAVVNTITKSGGNRVSFFSELQYTNDKLSSNNASPATIAVNPILGTPVQTLRMIDYSVQLGGPIVKDKLFFWGSAEYYNIRQRTYPRVVNEKIGPRFNFKMTWQPTPNDTVVGSLQFDEYNQTGRTGAIPGYAITSNSQTRSEPSPEFIYNAQYRKVFGPSMFFEAKYLGWWGYYNLLPATDEPTHFDGETGQYSGGAGYISQHDRTRNQLNASLTKYAKFAGTHNFKFGLEIERSTIRDRFEYAGGVFYYDYGGPYTAYGYSYDLKSKNSRESYYAQDQWKAGRFTANIGLRLDAIRGYDTRNGMKLYDTFSVGPRLGFAFDVSGKGSSVLRAYYGRLYDSANNNTYARALSGLTDTVYYDVGPDWSTLTEYDRVSGERYSMGTNLKHNRVDEYNISFEQQIARVYKVTATYIHRSWGNFINSVLIDGQWSPFTYTNAIGSAMPLWSWANRDTIDEKFLIQNVDTVNYAIADSTNPLVATGYRNYDGLMLIFERSFKDRWQTQISYVRSLTKGTVNNGTYDANYSGQFETPNTIIGLYDGPTNQNTTNQLKVFVGYQIPKIEVSVNAFYTYASGTPYAAVERVSRRNFNWPSNLNINISSNGTSVPDPVTRQSISAYVDSYQTVDMRFEKLFKSGANRFGVYLDVQNLLNRGGVTAYQTRYPSRTLTDNNGVDFTNYFGQPTELQSARQATFGVRWSF